MGSSPDLEKLSTSALREEFERSHRYEPSLRKSLGHTGYEARVRTLAALLLAQGIHVPVPTATARPSCRLRPLADHVVVLPDEAETVSAGGILIPETAKETPMQGEVVAVGPGRTEPGIGTVLPAVSIGDVVLFGRYSGLKIDLDGQALLIMREEDVLGVLTPKGSE
jgi:chaperonin GroES